MIRRIRLAFYGWLLTAGVAAAQTEAPKAPVAIAPMGSGAVTSADVKNAPALEATNPLTQTWCPSCNNSPLTPSGGPGVLGYGHHHNGGSCDSCGLLCGDSGCGGCGEGSCIPGRTPCVTCEGQSRVGRLFCAFHNALCCPDPCYEPRWIDAANSAMFTASARPYTMSRFRYSAMRNIAGANRGEFFQAVPPRGPAPQNNIRADTVSFYQEISSGGFSAIVETPYRSTTTGSGFGDLGLGTKTLLLDSELLTTSFQFLTYIPVGNASAGVGTGHVTLDPSMLGSVKLFTETYMQTQLGLFIPIGGTSAAQSTVLHYHASFNHVLCRPLADTSLIASMEFVGYTFFGGAVTNAGGVVAGGSGTIINLGPSIRMAICNKLDFGFGVNFATTGTRLAQQEFITEIRWRY